MDLNSVYAQQVSPNPLSGRPLCPSGTIDKCAGKLRVVSMLIQRICAWRDALYDE